MKGILLEESENKYCVVVISIKFYTVYLTYYIKNNVFFYLKLNYTWLCVVVVVLRQYKHLGRGFRRLYPNIILYPNARFKLEVFLIEVLILKKIYPILQ